jgi:hypothetical protein
MRYLSTNIRIAARQTLFKGWFFPQLMFVYFSFNSREGRDSIGLYHGSTGEYCCECDISMRMTFHLMHNIVFYGL